MHEKDFALRGVVTCSRSDVSRGQTVQHASAQVQRCEFKWIPLCTIQRERSRKVHSSDLQKRKKQQRSPLCDPVLSLHFTQLVRDHLS